MKKSIALFLPLCALSIVGLASCNTSGDENLVVLFTNDVHCAIDTNIGYAGLKAYKNNVLSDGNSVLLVDCGDHIQGSAVGSLSKGVPMIDLMNKVGYDLAVPGNHEFDYNADYFVNLSKSAYFKYISTNLLYTEDSSRVFDATRIYDRAGHKIGFVGICTPATIQNSSPKRFEDEEGNLKYTFMENDIDAFYANVQGSIDYLKSQNVEYVVALAHLGDEDTFTSESLIQNISGLDILLDGHSHATYSDIRINDKDGHEVRVSQTGTNLTNIGRLIFDKKGGVNLDLVNMSEWTKKDATIESSIKVLKDEYAAILGRKIGTTDFDLTIYDLESGKRLIRKKDTNIGNLVCDAYKAFGQTDIGLSNAGGVRATIKKGDITFGDAMNVSPFGNDMSIARITGQMLKDLIENGARLSPDENPTIVLPSGVTYTINTSIPSPVVVDPVGNFLRIEGEYRVSDILVNGEPLDISKKYTVTSTTYFLMEHLDSKVILKDAEILQTFSIIDSKVLGDYIEKDLKGIIPQEYANPIGGRITIA